MLATWDCKVLPCTHVAMPPNSIISKPWETVLILISFEIALSVVTMMSLDLYFTFWVRSGLAAKLNRYGDSKSGSLPALDSRKLY